MGKLIDGKWTETGYETEKHGGKYVREESTFRDWVRADGSTPFTPDKRRYHLYVSNACPWAHRTVIFRRLKGLDDAISISVVHPHMGKNGWTFESDDGVIPDSLNGSNYLYEIYQKADPSATCRVSTPVLWDKKSETIVNNESSEIIRMFNSEFGPAGATGPDFYPEELREEIDSVNELVYHNVNNGVYKTGFATEQEAYEEAYDALFDALDRLEERLEGEDYLVGEALTEADWRLFVTLIRFDPVYHYHFKCNKRRLRDYPNLWGHTQRLYLHPGISETVNLDHIKRHYYGSHKSINPTGIVPKGPEIEL